MNTYDYNENFQAEDTWSGMNVIQTKKAPNIFKQFIFSFIPPKYAELANAKVGSMILMVCIVVLFMSSLLFVVGIWEEGGINEMIGIFPDFEVRNGELFIEEPYFDDENNNVWYITDEIEEFHYEDVEYYLNQGNEKVVLIGRYNVCLYEDGEFKEESLEEFGDDIFSNEDIEQRAYPIVYVMFFCTAIIVCVGKVCWYFICSAIYLLIGMLIAKIMGKKISNVNTFKAAVYAKIPFFVIANIIKLFGIGFGVMAIPRELLTVIFFAFCIKHLPQKQKNPGSQN